jgi:hypothetical protein
LLTLLSHCLDLPVSFGSFGWCFTVLLLLAAKLSGQALLSWSAFPAPFASWYLLRDIRSFLSKNIFNSYQHNCCNNT